MESKFKVGDIVDWADGAVSHSAARYISPGPYKITRKEGSFWRIEGFREPIGPRGIDYYLVLDNEIKNNVFLTNVLTALALPTTTNRSEKEKEIE